MINTAVELARSVSIQKDEILKKQLSWLIERGMLEIQSGPEQLVQELNHDTGKYEIKFCQNVELVVKDKEYIEKLEAELKDLREFRKVILMAAEKEKGASDPLPHS